MKDSDVIDYWFGEGLERRERLWFGADPRVDAEIRERFGALLGRAARGEIDSWAETPRGRLALVLLFDQLSRNIFRNEPAAYANDVRACELVLDGLAKGFDTQLAPMERAFFYMPLMHAEGQAAQALSVERFARLAADAPEELRPQLQGFAGYAARHRDVVERFGRFPHRNALLGRRSTEEERSFLRNGKSF